ncbi:MAG: hypothetical protein ABIG44_11025 [Planctomycetota bacterium]
MYQSVRDCRHGNGLVRSCLAVALVGLALSAFSGCETPPRNSGAGAAKDSIDPIRIETRNDISAIYQFYQPNPWLRDADGQAVGFKVPVYFVSGETELGAFVAGRILVWLYELERQPDGSFERKFVHGWELDEQEAMGYRVRVRSVMGYHYGFMLSWPPNLGLAGKQIEIVFGYEKNARTIITGEPRRFRVPVSWGSQRPRDDDDQPRRPSELESDRSADNAAPPDAPIRRREPRP